MHKKIPDTTFDKLKDNVLSFFNEDHSQIKYVVTKEKQQQELELLRETFKYDDRFFFVVDLLNFDLKDTCGIRTWLGYSEKDFSLKFYFDHLVHPSRKQALFMTAEQLYTTLCKGAYPLQFMVQRFSSLVPLLHRNGNYILAKKTSSVFQYDVKNRLISYLNEFTRIGEYNGEPFNPVMYNSSGDPQTGLQKDIMAKVLKSFLSMDVFTAMQLQTARVIAYNDQITKAEIGDLFDLSPNTIDTHCKRFLYSARSLFEINFPTVQDAARYLRKEGLL